MIKVTKDLVRFLAAKQQNSNVFSCRKSLISTNLLIFGINAVLLALLALRQILFFLYRRKKVDCQESKKKLLEEKIT